jgi:hypothetical protein
MEIDSGNDAHLSQLVAELEGSEWRASRVPSTASDIACLRIERPSPTPGAGVQAMELCRRGLADAVKSARIHIFKLT